MQLIIHAAEQKFEDKIRESLDIKYYVPLMLAAQNGDEKDEDEDLFAFSSILCSSLFNKNDQYFPASELKLAKNSPVHKPINNYHIPNEIMGHMVSTFFLGADLQRLDDDFDESVHKCVHLATNSYLYKYNDPIYTGLRNKVNDIIASIKAGEMYVSMECQPSNYDYVLKAKDGSLEIIKRTEGNAELTELLRFFGGDGMYNGKKIGMCLRGIRFCGKGLVKNPANPQSVIFGGKEYFDENGKKMEASEQNSNDNVYKPEKEVNDKMEIEQQLEDVKAKLDASEKSVLALAEQKTSLENQIAEQNVKIGELTEKVTAAELVNDNLKVEVKKLERTKLLASSGIVAEAAENFIKEYNDVNDDMFAKVLNLQLKANETDKPKSDEINKTPDLDTVEKKNDAPLLSAAVTETPAPVNPLKAVFSPLSKDK